MATRMALSLASMKALARMGLIIAFASGLGSSAVLAQSPRPAAVGDRVRVASPAASGEYFVSASRADSLVLRTGPTSAEIPIELATVYRLEIFDGTTSRLWGMLGGGIVGAALGGLWAAPCAASQHYDCAGVGPLSRLEIGVGAGALVGALVWGGRARWRPAQLVARPALALSGDVGSSGDAQGFRPGPGQSFISGQPAEASGAGRTSSSDFVSSQELRAQGAQQEDAYTLVQRLHPNWLRPRMSAGPNTGAAPIPPMVFVNGTRYGEVERLRDFRLAELTSLEHIGATDATTRFGTGYGGGVILVMTRR